MIKTQLMDLNTPASVWDKLAFDMKSADSVIGLDCETEDSKRHKGLEAFNNKTRHVFDHRRTTMTGFSVYPDRGDTAYYFNLNHADVANRLPADIVKLVLDMKPEKVTWVAHNAPFEIVMFEQCHKIRLIDIICSLQLAVSCHGPDEYPIDKFYTADLNGMRPILPEILSNFSNFNPEKKRDLTPDQAFVLGQFIGKTAESEWSYNGFIKNIAWGFSLKKLTKSLYGVEQTSYETVLGNRDHMGQLTGQEVCAYGADDAYWAVKNYEKLIEKAMIENPAVLVTFFETENPMVQVYADVWKEGLRVNQKEVYTRRDQVRADFANLLVELKASIKSLLPFPNELNAAMVEHQSGWYPKSARAKRAQIIAWANSDNSDDSYVQCTQMSNPIGNAWMKEKGIEPPKGRFNITHYYTMRTLLHDLLGHKLVRVAGKVSTDKDARARMYLTFQQADDKDKMNLLRLLTLVSQAEQIMKLYLTPYTQLMDPETGCLYTVLSSMLASRRMGTRFPNPMQLAKRGETTYVRGFYLPDRDDHVIMSADWSSIELVEIGEFSGDPEFAKVFGQIPYGDLHSGAAVDCLAADPRYSWLTEEEFLNELRIGKNPMKRDLRNFAGQTLEPDKWVKFMRTEIGKGANFNYWYSGALGTVGERLGWSSETMWAATERYRERFSVAEQWRVGRIEEGRRNGYITLADNHRRVRFEATSAWRIAMRRKFAQLLADPAVLAYAELAMDRIQTRACNQLVNSDIQGMCAAIAKDSILAIRNSANRDAFRFMLPIHDELLFSVHKDYVMEFMPLLREKMCDHPKYFKKLPLHCTVSIGRNFKPYDHTNPAFSQIELDEAPVIEGLIGEEFRGKVLPPEEINKVLTWMMNQ